ncbi:MAG: response regulator [Pseudomonadota bacterium]
MGARILIIEDHPANMELMVYLLAAFGHQPLQAFDGETGVALAREALPDLIVCDIQLPKLDGFGVVAQLKADPATRAIPVLAASAIGVDDKGVAMRAAGFDGCLIKSAEPEQFIPDIEKFLPPRLRSASASASAAPAPHAAHAGATAPHAAAGARVVLLDAAPGNAGLVASILQACGHTLSVTGDVLRFAHLARECDLAVCDFDQADADWPARCARVMADAAGAGVPLLVLHAGDARVPAAAPGRPSAHFLSYPIEAGDLVDAVAGALAGRR